MKRAQGLPSCMNSMSFADSVVVTCRGSAVLTPHRWHDQQMLYLPQAQQSQICPFTAAAAVSITRVRNQHLAVTTWSQTVCQSHIQSTLFCIAAEICKQKFTNLMISAPHLHLHSTHFEESVTHLYAAYTPTLKQAHAGQQSYLSQACSNSCGQHRLRLFAGQDMGPG